MKRTCQYCDSPLLETDTICWHCGRPQPTQSSGQAAFAESNTESEEAEVEAELEPVGNARALWYATLTLLVILALLLAMRSLGRSPIMVYGAGAPEGDWVAISSPDDSFSIEIPAAWQWQFAGDEDANPGSFAPLAQRDQVLQAVRPLADLVPDTDYRMIAAAENAILVIARSERLNRLSPQQAAAALPAEEFRGLTIVDAGVVPGEAGQSRTTIAVSHEDPPLRCDQHLVPSSNAAYLAAVCSPEIAYDEQQGTFAQVLNSFSLPRR